MQSAGQKPDRKQILGPYVEWLDEAMIDSDPARGSVQIGGNEIAIDAWEFSIVTRQRLYYWQVLVAEGIALLAKLEDDRARLRKSVEGAAESLKADAAIGFAASNEMQRAVDELVVEGDMEAAKKLTAFRNRLGKAIGGLKDDLGPEALADAEGVAADLVAMREPDWQKQRDERKQAKLEQQQERWKAENIERLSKLEAELNQRAQQEQQEKKPFAPAEAGAAVAMPVDPHDPAQRSRAPLLLLVLAVLTAAWLVLVGIPAANKVEFPEFSTADFSLPAIESVTSRAPSLFVTVDADEWAALDDVAKHRLVLEIAGKVEPAGYVGARLIDDRGRTVAQWMHGTGVTVYKELRPES